MSEIRGILEYDMMDKERQAIFDRLVENIKGVADTQTYYKGELVGIGTAFIEGSWIEVDPEESIITVYENNQEMITIDRANNILLMLSELLK